MVRLSVCSAMVVGALVLASACGDDDTKSFKPGEGSGSSSGGASGTGGSTSLSAGQGGDGGTEPAPVFTLPCGNAECMQGQVCCLGTNSCLGDPALCMGVPLACDDTGDCNADGGTPEVCCAVYEVGTFDRTECTSKGGCEGAGRVRVCTGVEECDECAAAMGAPMGMKTCGPPP